MPFPKKERKEEKKHIWVDTQIMQELSTNDGEKIQNCKCDTVFHIFKKNVIQDAVCQYLHARNNFIH